MRRDLIYIIGYLCRLALFVFVENCCWFSQVLLDSLIRSESHNTYVYYIIKLYKKSIKTLIIKDSTWNFPKKTEIERTQTDFLCIWKIPILLIPWCQHCKLKNFNILSSYPTLPTFYKIRPEVEKTLPGILILLAPSHISIQNKFNPLPQNYAVTPVKVLFTLKKGLEQLNKIEL